MPILTQARAHALRQIDRTLAATAGCFPHYTEGGRWVSTQDGSWTGGMWVGQLWIAYQWTGDQRYRDAALNLLPVLEKRIDRADADFDLGFLLVPSFVRGYQILGDDQLCRIALRGASRMLDFFHERTGLIYTIYPERTALYDRPVGSAIVDIMMNLSLLWWAGKETGDPSYHDVARSHSERTTELHVRADGSTFHVLDFDLEDGKLLHQGTIHGYSDDSTWARGQAWALHGFAQAYRATGVAAFLEVDELLSYYFYKRLPTDGRPYWDLCDPAIPETVRDTSAATIAAAGWLKMPGDWPSIGRRLIKAVAATSLTTESAGGIVADATAYKTQGRGIQGATVWGDYFLLRGLIEEDEAWLI